MKKNAIIVLFKSQLPQVKTKKQLCDNNVSISGNYFYYRNLIIIAERGWVCCATKPLYFLPLFPLFVLFLSKVLEQKMKGDRAAKLSITDTKQKPNQHKTPGPNGSGDCYFFTLILQIHQTLTFSGILLVSRAPGPASALASPNFPYWWNLSPPTLPAELETQGAFTGSQSSKLQQAAYPSPPS